MQRDVWPRMVSGENGWRDCVMQTRGAQPLPGVWANVRLPDGLQIGIGIDIRDGDGRNVN